jgi:hypothetical protein
MSSYVLDRDVLLSALGSGRATAQLTTTHHLHASQPVVTTSATSSNPAWIDVNSNAALIGNSVYQRTSFQDTEIRKQVSDVQSHFSFFMIIQNPKKKENFVG